MTTRILSNDAKRLGELANAKLNLLSGQCQEREEVQDYYLGILRRQAIILLDLHLILNNRFPELITTPFMILRGLMDDFLHVLYLELHDNKESEITNINAKAYKQSFQSLKSLTESNYAHFEGKYQHYLTYESLKETQIIFASKPQNDRYFLDKAQFKFKNFIPLTQVAESINSSRDVNIFKDRAFYLWQEFSSFVHYSNTSFYLETNADPIHLLQIDEAFQYCYNTIYLSSKYFERILSINFIDDEELKNKYGIIYEC